MKVCITYLEQMKTIGYGDQKINNLNSETSDLQSSTIELGWVWGCMSYADVGMA